MTLLHSASIRGIKVYQKNDDGTITYYPRFTNGITFERIKNVVSSYEPNICRMPSNNVNERDITLNIDTIGYYDNNDFDESYDIQSTTDYSIHIGNSVYYVIYVLLEGYPDEYKFILR